MVIIIINRCFKYWLPKSVLMLLSSAKVTLRNKKEDERTKNEGSVVDMDVLCGDSTEMRCESTEGIYFIYICIYIYIYIFIYIYI
jgi:hypothetical protein